jgi:outer membrane protein OmpA-like peptidoglycan-associated protein
MKTLTILLLALISQMSFAQAPTAAQMIEQLKAKPASATSAPDGATTPPPRTRSLGAVRNLTVEAATQQEVAAAAVTTAAVATVVEKASLSLQIQFDFNSASVKTESKESLANLATAMQSKDLLEAKFVIEGHTDAKGKQDYNQRLSQHRADSVREFLVSKGVDGVRLSTAGKGSSDPANTADPLSAENRRVKIVNLQ